MPVTAADMAAAARPALASLFICAPLRREGFVDPAFTTPGATNRIARACPERAKRVEGACPERAKRVEGRITLRRAQIPAPVSAAGLPRTDDGKGRRRAAGGGGLVVRGQAGRLSRAGDQGWRADPDPVPDGQGSDAHLSAGRVRGRASAGGAGGRRRGD